MPSKLSSGFGVPFGCDERSKKRDEKQSDKRARVSKIEYVVLNSIRQLVTLAAFSRCFAPCPISPSSHPMRKTFLLKLICSVPV